MYNIASSAARRNIANIMCIMMLFCVLFSAFFLAAETGHECADEDCPVCACIQYCENILKRISDDVPVLLCALVSVIVSTVILMMPESPFVQKTLVLNKVRLNN